MLRMAGYSYRSNVNFWHKEGIDGHYFAVQYTAFYWEPVYSSIETIELCKALNTDYLPDDKETTET